MLKRLWLILGPVFCAMALVATLLFFYPINHKHNLTEEKKAAVSLTAEGFKSRARKEEALGDPNYVLYLSLVLANGCGLISSTQQY